MALRVECQGCCLLCVLQANAFGVDGGGAIMVDGGGAPMVDIDEVELLNDVEMGGMSHGELVTHIRKVQQELLAKVRVGDMCRYMFVVACTCCTALGVRSATCKLLGPIK